MLGPIEERSIQQEVEWRGEKYQLQLKVFAHGYSTYDRTQADGVIDDWEVYSGLASLTPADLQKTPNKAKLQMPVVGTKRGSLVELRLLEPSTISKELSDTQRNMRLWMVSMLAASPEVVDAYRRKYLEQESEIASSMAGRPIVHRGSHAVWGTG